MDDTEYVFKEITTVGDTINIECQAVEGDTWELTGKTRDTRFPNSGGWNDAQDYTFRKIDAGNNSYSKEGSAYPV